MKTCLVSSILFVVVTVTFITGCKNEPAATSQKSGFHFALADSLLNKYNTGRHPREWSLRADGKATIKVEDKLVTIEHIPDTGVVTTTYYMQTNNVPDIKTGVFGKAEVIYMDKYFILNSLESRKFWFFSLEGDPEPVYLQEIKDVVRYAGHGIAMRRVLNGTPDYVPECWCYPNGQSDENCKSGGIDALSCASGTAGGICKIRCSGSTFACCDIMQ